MSLEILFEDADVVAVRKPPGLLVHRSRLAEEANVFALQMVRDQLGARVFPVHRLDRPTSGVLLFARSSENARALTAQFAGGQVRKTYITIVRGAPREDQFAIDYPLREELDAVADRHARDDKPAQSALTEVTCLARCELPVAVDKYPTSRYALIAARPLTGRKHQIRRHLRHLGHPVIGDVTHGVGKHNRFFAERFGVRRLWLACVRLEFTHPRTSQPLDVRAPLDAEFRRVLVDLGWEAHVDHV